jgi:phage terminase large subunit-like protein
VRLACKRFVADLERDDLEAHEDGGRWCYFLECLPHVKGRWASRGERFVLSDWQVFATVNLYGWKRKSTGRRRFREGYIEVPRKNGKSFWVAGLGVAHMCIDGEHGAEVYCGATTEAQAWEVFRPAKLICERSPELVQRWGIEVNAKTIVAPRTGSRFAPVIGNPGDGASPSAAIADEFHEHKTSDQVDTFTTGMGAREQPMMLHITTAGSDMGGPCYAKRADVIDILKGTVEDDNVFGIIYGLDEGDAWDTVEAVKKANPNYGISVDAEFLAGQLAQARRSALKQNSYRTKHLNEWVGARTAWLNMLAYQACRKRDLSLDDFKGSPCFAALDLASKTDVACLALLFQRDDRYAVFLRHYLPEDVVLESGNTRYKEWHRSGWLTTTPGNIIDYSVIEDDLREVKSAHEVVEVPYDPFQATQFATRMTEEGFPMVEFGATVKNFSEPMKQLEALILTKRIDFEMDPVLMWMFGNVVSHLDAKDNVFPRKERPEAKIDGVVAIIMALARAMFHEDDSITVPADYSMVV